jgi:hypothetical protein
MMKKFDPAAGENVKPKARKIRSFQIQRRM